VPSDVWPEGTVVEADDMAQVWPARFSGRGLRYVRVAGCVKGAAIAGAAIAACASVPLVHCSPDSPATVQLEQRIVPDTSLKELAANPESYLGRTVQVTGRLENIGKNYFTDLRVGLKGEDGAFVYVTPWLPLELPPSPPGGSRPSPATLSEYLDRTVNLRGVLERVTLKGAGEVYSIRVESAEIVR
jgi:hypothetical protein